MKEITRTVAGLLLVLLASMVGARVAAASVDMTGEYVPIEYPSCRWAIVQTGTDLQITVTCGEGPSNLLWSGPGTVDVVTGTFSATSSVGRCPDAVVHGTADGEQFSADFTLPSDLCGGPAGHVTGTKCLNGTLDPGEECQDGNAVDGDCCSSRCRLEPAGSACTSDNNVCTDDVCDDAGLCLHQPNTATCEDGNSCTIGDTCSSGLCASGVPASRNDCTQSQACERTVARALSSCIARVGAQTRQCYLRSGAACPQSDAQITGALARMRSQIEGQCPDEATVRALGYGAAATPATVIARAQEECTGEAASIAARTFGGPQGALLVDAEAATTRCLSSASAAAVKLVKHEATLRARCVAKAHGRGAACDVARTDARIADAESKAIATIEEKCPALKATTGLDAADYVSRAAAQARCVTAASHGNTGSLALDCGPRTAVEVPPRGTWTKVVLDYATYGTICGDGSPYAFWMRLPPVGMPSEKVVVDAQGGGLCVFESDCVAASRNLSNAVADDRPTTGIFSTSAAANPFSDWTMVFLPLCTQDLHIGGGVTDVFPSVTVRRFGAINLRAALRYVRDVLWQDLAATEPEGYRPDRLTVIFGGESSGGTGVNYNYHYLLDDLRWAHTIAVPDSGHSLDNGQDLGVRSLGVVAQAETGNLAWGTRPFQPPYCLDSSCFIEPVLQAATSARLKTVPEQQILNVSNQADDVQASSNLFPSLTAWINAVRAGYCTNQGLNGIRNWLPARSTSFHTILTNAARWSSVTAGDQTLPAFLLAAMTNPDAVADHVDEGTLVTDYPGVNPIACPTQSPSGRVRRARSRETGSNGHLRFVPAQE